MASRKDELDDTLRRWDALSSEAMVLVAERDELLEQRSDLLGKRALMLREMSRLGRRFVDVVTEIAGGR
jgi:hypothetical protein